MEEFIAMGGYARFVWPSFGLTALILIGNIVTARRRLRRIHQELATRLARSEQLRKES